MNVYKRSGKHRGTRTSRDITQVLMGVALFVLTGCTTSGGPYTAPPPKDITPLHVSLGLVGAIDDSDENGFPDTITAMMIVRGNHAVSITPPGSFTFTLLTEDDTEVVRWEISEEMTRAAAANHKIVGPSFIFRLNIRDKLSSDRMQAVSLGLTGTFYPTDGQPIRSSGRRYVQFGRDY